MFEGGLRGFLDDVVNTIRCIGADTAYKKSQLRRIYYQQSDQEQESAVLSVDKEEIEGREQEISM